MKLTTSNTFDVSAISDSQTYQDAQAFFDYVNGFTSDVVMAFNKRITFSDNMSYASIPLQVQHGTATNIGKYNPIGVFLRSETSILSYNLATNADSTLNISIFFKETHNTFSKSAAWQVGTIVRYQLQDVNPFSVGDVLRINNFTNAANNGVFLVQEIDVENKYVYVNNRNRYNALGDELKVGFSGAPLIKHPVVIGLVLS